MGSVTELQSCGEADIGLLAARCGCDRWTPGGQGGEESGGLARTALQGAGCTFCVSSTPAITTEQQIPGLTCCSVGSAKGGSGNRRSGSGISSCFRSLWVPGTAGDFKQRAPVATSAPQEGPSRARGPLCSCVCTSAALAGGTSCLFSWNKEQAWLDWGLGSGGAGVVPYEIPLCSTVGEAPGACLPVADRE